MNFRQKKLLFHFSFDKKLNTGPTDPNTIQGLKVPLRTGHTFMYNINNKTFQRLFFSDCSCPRHHVTWRASRRFARGTCLADVEVQREVPLSRSWSAEHWHGVLSILSATGVARPLCMKGCGWVFVCQLWSFSIIILITPISSFSLCPCPSTAFMRLSAQEEAAEACLSFYPEYFRQ